MLCFHHIPGPSDYPEQWGVLPQNDDSTAYYGSSLHLLQKILLFAPIGKGNLPILEAYHAFVQEF